MAILRVRASCITIVEIELVCFGAMDAFPINSKAKPHGEKDLTPNL